MSDTATKRRWLRFVPWSLLVLAMVVAASYAIRPEQEPPWGLLDTIPADDRQPDVERDKIEALAIAAVNREAMQPIRFYVRATREGERWSVHVQCLPLMPGNFCVLRMSATGEVLEWIGGA